MLAQSERWLYFSHILTDFDKNATLTLSTLPLRIQTYFRKKMFNELKSTISLVNSSAKQNAIVRD